MSNENADSTLVKRGGGQTGEQCTVSALRSSQAFRGDGYVINTVNLRQAERGRIRKRYWSLAKEEHHARNIGGRTRWYRVPGELGKPPRGASPLARRVGQGEGCEEGLLAREYSVDNCWLRGPGDSSQC